MTSQIQDFSSRDSLLSTNSVLITQLQSRLKAKRFRLQEGDSIRISYMRTLIQALQCQNNILRDVEMEELKKDVEELKELMKCRCRE